MSTSAAPAVSPALGGLLDVGDRAELFVDSLAVGRTEGIAFTIHPARKHPMNPLIKCDQPWEGWWVRIMGGTVLFDEQDQLFKMWYFTVSDCFPDFGVLYATSRDGVSWEKPLVGTVNCASHPRHNAVLEHIEMISIMRDPAEKEASRRFKMLGYDNRKNPKAGPRAFVSADGLNWTEISEGILFASSDVMTAFRDRRSGKYVAFPKISTDVRGVKGRRCFGVRTSADLLNWTEPKMAFVPDLRDDAGSLARLEQARAILLSKDNPELTRAEFYGVGFYQAESCVVGFPWLCTINDRLPWGSEGGVCEVQLASSRDLETWERPFRDPVIPLGEPGTWDCGFLTSATEAIRHGDQILLYYNAQNYAHGDPAAKKDPGPSRKAIRAIGLATWPLDRFVSADGGSEAGRLTTVPLKFSGRRLELNLNPRKGGRVRVELLDLRGRPIDGFGASDPLVKDGLRETVTWKGNSDVSRLAGTPVMVRFELQNAELYSFAFRSS